MGDGHEVVVHDGGEVVGGHPVGFDEDGVVLGVGVHFDAATDGVVDDDLARGPGLDPRQRDARPEDPASAAEQGGCEVQVAGERRRPDVDRPVRRLRRDPQRTARTVWTVELAIVRLSVRIVIGLPYAVTPSDPSVRLEALIWLSVPSALSSIVPPLYA